jgi:hypothetical protein
MSIKSIIPAPAALRYHLGNYDDGRPYFRPVVALALVDPPESYRADGLTIEPIYLDEGTLVTGQTSYAGGESVVTEQQAEELLDAWKATQAPPVHPARARILELLDKAPTAGLPKRDLLDAVTGTTDVKRHALAELVLAGIALEYGYGYGSKRQPFVMLARHVVGFAVAPVHS